MVNGCFFPYLNLPHSSGQSDYYHQCRHVVVAFHHAVEVLRAIMEITSEAWVATIFTPGVSLKGNRADPLHPDNKSCQVFQVRAFYKGLHMMYYWW